MVYNGPGDGSAPTSAIERISGQRNDVNLQSVGSVAAVRFRSSGSNQRHGFVMAYTSVGQAGDPLNRTCVCRLCYVRGGC